MKDEDTKEEFCGPCAALVPLALGGAGVAGSGAAGNKKTKNIVLGISIAMIIISIIIYFWLKSRCTTCG